jgi:hypothetical protein
MLITVKRAPMVRSSCKSCVLQHPINMSHIIILKKLQKIKMRTRSANQSEKIPKTELDPLHFKRNGEKPVHGYDCFKKIYGIKSATSSSAS